MRVLARLASRDMRFARPVLVDVGGATTDVHSLLPLDPRGRGYGQTSVPDQEATRTVEADLGVRESAETLVAEVERCAVVGEASARQLRPAAALRARDRGFLASEAREEEIDAELAALAASIALARHAGTLKVALSGAGATLRKTGRDLRNATCVVGSGGVFEHAADGVGLLREALQLAREQRALLPDDASLVIDAQHAVAAAGLVAAERPRLAEALLVRELVTGTQAHVA
jgi:uncharacterized protein (TIGR01319 family)